MYQISAAKKWLSFGLGAYLDNILLSMACSWYGDIKSAFKSKYTTCHVAET